MTTNRFSLVPRRNTTALAVRLLAALLAASLATARAAGASTCDCIARGELLLLLRSPKKVCNICYLVLHMFISLQPPELYPEDPLAVQWGSSGVRCRKTPPVTAEPNREHVQAGPPPGGQQLEEPNPSVDGRNAR